jgi:hypothetical protein
MHLRDLQRERVATTVDPSPDAAAAQYNLELTLTFDAVPDPFALVSPGAEAAPVVSVHLNGKTLVELREGSPPGVPWLQEGISGVSVGTNELLIEATPPVGAAHIRHAVRVRLIENTVAIADETFWSDGASKVGGAVRFQVDETSSEHNDGH